MFEKFKLFRKFRFKKWQTYSPQKRLECAQKFENYFSKKQGRSFSALFFRARLISRGNRRSPTERRIYIRRREETAIERKNSNIKGENRRFSTLDFLLI